MKAKNFLAKVGTMAAVAAMFIAGTSIPASADNFTNGNVPDPGKKVTLTVHKYLSTTNPQNTGTGIELDQPGELEGFGEKIGSKDKSQYAIFKITKLKEEVADADGTVAKGNEGINDSTTTDNLKNEDFSDTVYYGKTDGNGDITTWFADAGEGEANPVKKTDGKVTDIDTTKGTAATLDQGYWYLQEEKGVDGYKLAAASIVSLPMGFMRGSEDKETSTFNYDVHVYPKNVDNTEVKKEVTDKKDVYKPNDKVNWKITGNVNHDLKVTGEDKVVRFGEYSITDVVDSRLDVDAENITVFIQELRAAGQPEGKVKLERNIPATPAEGSNPETPGKPGDYDLTVKKEDDGKTTVLISLTEQGMTAVDNNKSNQIFINIPTTINQTAFAAADQDTIDNGATMKFTSGKKTEDAKPEEGGGTIEDPKKPYITLASIKVIKTDKNGLDKDGNGTRLANAKFKVALSEADAKAGKFLGREVIEKDKDGNDVTKTEDIELTTDSNGEGYISGIPFGALAADGKSAVLYLWETQSPAGYERSKVVTEVELTFDKKTVGKVEFKTFNGTAAIKNYKPGDEHDGGKHFNLPLTGGTGSVIFMIAGLGLVGLSLAFLLKDKKKA